MTLLIITDGKISDSASTVPIIAVNDVTASRALGITYTNTTGRTMHLLISIQITGYASVLLLHNGAEQASVGYGGATHPTAFEEIVGIIPPGDTYMLSPVYSGGSLSINRWTEAY